MRVFISILLLSLATIANSQSYPDYSSTTVNDFSGLLSPEAEARIVGELTALKEDTGIEMTVVTLSRRAMFTDNQTLEEFATGLFNHWGIGNKDSNDGVLVLIMHTDREMRVELGKSYGRAWDGVAEMVVDRSFLPLFKEGQYEAGIEKGVNDVIATIARPFHARAAPPEVPTSGISGWWLALGAVPILLLAFWSKIKDTIASKRPCPTCGKRTLHVRRKTTKSASKAAAGSGERVTDCSNCDYRDVNVYTISRLSKSSSSSGSSFGGGSSGGGGASGKW